MKDLDTTSQLPLPTMKKAVTEVVKLPLTTRNKNNRGITKPNTKPRRQTLWYALYFPQLAELCNNKQTHILHEIADLVESVSSVVSFHPQSLICEIRSSLRYFGGINNIHDKLKALVIPKLQEHTSTNYFLYAASPTVSGSLLLARSGQNTLVYRKENLRSALGQLPTGVMLLDKEQNRRLYNMGIRKIRDIWRLPPDELRKRFGSDFVNLLNKALGITHEPTHNYVPPPAFTTSYDLPYEIENLNRLLPIVDEMLIQLCEFLKNRDLNTDHLKLFLLHENRNHTDLDLNLRQASRCRKHLLLLIETHFGNLNIPAPVIGLKISVKKFDAFIGESDQLLMGNLIVGKSNSNSANNTLNHLIEQLQARLGFDSLKSISAIAEHGPEYAVRQLNYKESRILTSITPVVTNRRPFWLLENPIQLTLRNGQLYHDQFIILISGPERVETYWWSSQEIQRNYYIARKVSGSRLWIFRECKGKRNWYLHGYFA